MVIKSRRLRWVKDAEHMGEMRMDTQFWSENMKGGDRLEDIGVEGRTILKWNLKE
jgi:hypothetical protein